MMMIILTRIKHFAFWYINIFYSIYMNCMSTAVGLTMNHHYLWPVPSEKHETHYLYASHLILVWYVCLEVHIYGSI